METTSTQTAQAPDKRQGKPTIFNVYPKDDDQRDRIAKAAKKQGMKNSPFFLWLAEQFISGNLVLKK